MATRDYVAVAGDDWYQRRRDDAEGKFFLQVADQGPRKGAGGSTRQGIYCLTADGKLLTYKNAGQDPDAMRDTLRRGLAEWRKLPESRRKPGAVQVPDETDQDRRFHRALPPGGVVVNVYTRLLEQDKQGDFRACPNGREAEPAAARDHLWLTKEDVQALVSVNAKQGERYAMPACLAERLLRFHLNENTRGEPPHWQRDEIRAKDLTLAVEKVDASSVRLRLEGKTLISTDADPAKAERGYDARLFGFIEMDRQKMSVRRFDVVALGEHWGEGTYTPGARPGRTPLGVAFELARGDAADAVPPQGARGLQEYLGRDK